MTRAIVNTYELDNALRKVVPFCSTDDARPVLKGVYFEACATNRLRMTGADGFRLASVEIDAEVDEAFSALIDAKYLPMLDTKKRRYTPIDTVIDPRFSMSLGKFPNYEAVFPKNIIQQIPLPDDFLEHVEAFAKMTKAYNHCLHWSITPDGHVLEIKVDSDDFYRCFLFEIEVKKRLQCEPVFLSVNVKFLVDILRAGYGMPLMLSIASIDDKRLVDTKKLEAARMLMITGESARWLAMPMYFNEYDIRYPGGKNANPRN